MAAYIIVDGGLMAHHGRRGCPRGATLLNGLVAALLMVSHAPAEAGPGGEKQSHVSECNFCRKCSQPETPVAVARRSLVEAMPAEDTSAHGRRLNLLDLTSSEGDMREAPRIPEGVEKSGRKISKWTLKTAARMLGHPKVHQYNPHEALWKRYHHVRDANQVKGNCTKCSGCTHNMAELPRSQVFHGQHFKKETGKSSAMVLKVSSPHSKSGVALAKLWCLPFSSTDGKFNQESCAAGPDAKDPGQRMAVTDQEAMYAVANDCGLSEIIPRQWVENITAVMPETGYAIVNQPALMQEYVEGISLNALSRHRNKTFVADALKNIRPHHIVAAALYDTLFSQSDRHLQNILIDRKANVRLIDNDKALENPPNSIFLPGTLYHAYNVFGRLHVNSRGIRPMAPASPFHQMDYRCHSEGGQIGREYPDRFKTCLRKLISLGEEGIREEYGFSSEDQSKSLSGNARVMLDLGFEQAMERIQSPEDGCRRFHIHRPCCKWTVDSTGSSVCADDSWQPVEWAGSLPCSRSETVGKESTGTVGSTSSVSSSAGMMGRRPWGP